MVPLEIKDDLRSIRKELSAAFFKIGLITFGLGILAILAGVYLKYSLNAVPLVSILPLLICLPIILAVNWWFIWRTIKRINMKTSDVDK